MTPQTQGPNGDPPLQAAADVDSQDSSLNDPPTTEKPAPASPAPSPGQPGGSIPFGAQLEPVLREACASGVGSNSGGRSGGRSGGGGELSPVRWFRTDWQRGGALTGYATLTEDHSSPTDSNAAGGHCGGTSEGHSGGGGGVEVVVKMPITPAERVWLMRLQDFEDVVPRVYAQGALLGGYDIAWVVMEKLPYGPLSSSWGGKQFDLLIEAVGRFYAAAEQFPPPAGDGRAGPGPGRDVDWQQILERSRKRVAQKCHGQEKRWNKALKKAQKILNQWLTQWRQRPADQWCHGDLHLANAMTRCAPPDGPALLLDFALTRPGHWTEDGVYLEHLYWAQRDRLGGCKPCPQIAKQRRKLGLSVDKDWARWASIRRGLMALRAPSVDHLSDSPQHLQASLEVLEAELSGG